MRVGRSFGRTPSARWSCLMRQHGESTSSRSWCGNWRRAFRSLRMRCRSPSGTKIVLSWIGNECIGDRFHPSPVSKRFMRSFFPLHFHIFRSFSVFFCGGGFLRSKDVRFPFPSLPTRLRIPRRRCPEQLAGLHSQLLLKRAVHASMRAW